MLNVLLRGGGGGAQNLMHNVNKENNLMDCACVLSHFSGGSLFATPWTVACQAPLSMGFPRILGGLPFPSPEDLPHPGIEPSSLTSSALQAVSLPLPWDCAPAQKYHSQSDT